MGFFADLCEEFGVDIPPSVAKSVKSHREKKALEQTPVRERVLAVQAGLPRGGSPMEVFDDQLKGVEYRRSRSYSAGPIRKLPSFVPRQIKRSLSLSSLEGSFMDDDLWISDDHSPSLRASARPLRAVAVAEMGTCTTEDSAEDSALTLGQYIELFACCGAEGENERPGRPPADWDDYGADLEWECGCSPTAAPWGARPKGAQQHHDDGSFDDGRVDVLFQSGPGRR